MTPEQMMSTLEQWAKVVKARSEIEEFMAWLEDTGIGRWSLSMPLPDVLDKFYDIDRRKLDEARSQLLATVREEKDS